MSQKLSDVVKAAASETVREYFAPLGSISRMAALAATRAFPQRSRDASAPDSVEAPKGRSPGRILLEPASGLSTLLVASITPISRRFSAAVVIATEYAERGMRVLLVDADMSGGSLHEIFEVSPGLGLEDVLAGSASLKDVVKSTKVPGLFLVPSGLPTYEPDVLQSTTMRRFIALCSEDYDVTVFHSRPLGIADDALLLSAGVEGVVLAVSVKDSGSDQALSELSKAGANVIGVILVDVRGDNPAHAKLEQVEFSFKY